MRARLLANQRNENPMQTFTHTEYLVANQADLIEVAEFHCHGVYVHVDLVNNEDFCGYVVALLHLIDTPNVTYIDSLSSDDERNQYFGFALADDADSAALRKQAIAHAIALFTLNADEVTSI